MGRNLLFLVVDCLRAEMCSGNHRPVQMPTIDRLAVPGTVFTKPEVAEQLKQMIFRIHQGYPASSMTSGLEETRESGKDVPEEDLEHTLE